MSRRRALTIPHHLDIVMHIGTPWSPHGGPLTSCGSMQTPGSAHTYPLQHRGLTYPIHSMKVSWNLCSSHSVKSFPTCSFGGEMLCSLFPLIHTKESHCNFLHIHTHPTFCFWPYTQSGMVIRGLSPQEGLLMFGYGAAGIFLA